eukprot:10876190-Heterocapsa_arctica.AAC.1
MDPHALIQPTTIHTLAEPERNTPLTPRDAPPYRKGFPSHGSLKLPHHLHALPTCTPTNKPHPRTATL